MTRIKLFCARTKTNERTHEQRTHIDRERHMSMNETDQNQHTHSKFNALVFVVGYACMNMSSSIPLSE